MVQREVAERIAAPPGKMSYLSVFVQYHARVRIAFTVRPDAFEPAPAVESAVILMEPFDADDRLGPDEEDELWRLVQASFRERRKMLHNVLARQLPFDAGRRPRHSRPPGIHHLAGHRLSRGVVAALREALGPIGSDRLSRATRSARDGRRGPVPASRARRPARPGQAEPHPGRGRAAPDGFHDLHLGVRAPRRWPTG